MAYKYKRVLIKLSGEGLANKDKHLAIDYELVDKFAKQLQIIISPWKIKKQAMEFNHSLRREFCYIFAHGVAHLFGFDHQTEEETKIMNGHVDNIMAKLGINRY